MLLLEMQKQNLNVLKFVMLIPDPALKAELHREVQLPILIQDIFLQISGKQDNTICVGFK